MNRFSVTAIVLAGVISLGAAYVGPGAANNQQTNGPNRVSVYFRPGAATLTKPAGALLDEMASLLKTNGATRLLITGYASDGGTAPRDQRIAEARADAVENGLVSRGVDAARIRVGVGESAALGQPDAKPGFIAERRTDILIEPGSANRFDF